MYNTKSLIMSLFKEGFEPDSIQKITNLLNKDVTTNILDELIAEKTHKLAVSNFNKTLLAQNKELAALKTKVAEYERDYAIRTHDRSANPWRKLITDMESYDQLPETTTHNGYLYDRVTGNIVGPDHSPPSEMNLDTRYGREGGDGDVDDVIQSDVYLAFKAKADEQRLKAEKNKQCEEKKSEEVREGVSIKDMIKAEQSDDDMVTLDLGNMVCPPRSIRGKNGVKSTTKKAVKKPVKKKPVKKATKKATKKVTKKSATK